MKPKRQSRQRVGRPAAKGQQVTGKAANKSASAILAERERERKQLRSVFAALIETNPQEAARKAGVFLEIARETLTVLINSDDCYASQDSEYIRCKHVRQLADELVQLVIAERRHSLATIWQVACQFAKAIHDFALQATPRSKARDNLVDIGARSFFLPSLRSRNRKFTFNFEKVADAVQLSDFCVVKMDEESLARLDTPVTMFVAETLEGIERLRKQAKQVQLQLALSKFNKLFRLKPLKEGRSPNLDGVTEAELRKALRRDYPKEQIPRMLECLRLPDLNTDTIEQWGKVVCAIIDDPETLKRLEGTRLYRTLAKGNGGKEYKMRDELKLRAKQAMDSTLIPAPGDSAHSRWLRRRERRSPANPMKPGGV